MAKKAAWIDVPMTDKEIADWERIRAGGFVWFLFRYGVAITFAMGVFFGLVHFVRQFFDAAPAPGMSVEMTLLFGSPCFGPVMAMFVCTMTWGLQTQKYEKTMRARDALPDARSKWPKPSERGIRKLRRAYGIARIRWSLQVFGPPAASMFVHPPNRNLPGSICRLLCAAARPSTVPRSGRARADIEFLGLQPVDFQRTDVCRLLRVSGSTTRRRERPDLAAVGLGRFGTLHRVDCVHGSSGEAIVLSSTGVQTAAAVVEWFPMKPQLWWRGNTAAPQDVDLFSSTEIRADYADRADRIYRRAPQRRGSVPASRSAPWVDS